MLLDSGFCMGLAVETACKVDKRTTAGDAGLRKTGHEERLPVCMFVCLQCRGW